MEKADEDRLIRSYRFMLESYANLVRLADVLVSAQRDASQISGEELRHIEQQLARARQQIQEISRLLALTATDDRRVH